MLEHAIHRVLGDALLSGDPVDRERPVAATKELVRRPLTPERADVPSSDGSLCRFGRRPHSLRLRIPRHNGWSFQPNPGRFGGHLVVGVWCPAANPEPARRSALNAKRDPPSHEDLPAAQKSRHPPSRRARLAQLTCRSNGVLHEGP